MSVSKWFWILSALFGLTSSTVHANTICRYFFLYKTLHIINCLQIGSADQSTQPSWKDLINLLKSIFIFHAARQLLWIICLIKVWIYFLDSGYHVNLTSNLTWICSLRIHTLRFTRRFTHCRVLGNAKRNSGSGFYLVAFYEKAKSLFLINRIPSHQIFTNIIGNSVATTRPRGSTPRKVGWECAVRFLMTKICVPTLFMTWPRVQYLIYDLTKSSMPYVLLEYPSSQEKITDSQFWIF